ncbi:hypothetical protein H1V43_23945 [Streptomyces sp. PSKA54]|uniref:Uncharacterized protein n=1 Tax=Streptomyces himalayensis subsp. aureolus TaxID=2758039 RepID=A0A7W2D421_9ACTN|nr:DUF6233 domain-containing protein [Streptomyces himalayensis]MBA4864350.1 hypothetical protein [Streptomyces himalayensis subsp. aureolus]
MLNRPPSRLDLLRFLERVQLADLQRTRKWIADEERRETERRRLEQARPPAPDWVVQMSLGAQHPMAVHVGGCHMAGKHFRGLTREQAMRARAEGVDGCGHCGVDAELGYLD